MPGTARRDVREFHTATVLSAVFDLNMPPAGHNAAQSLILIGELIGFLTGQDPSSFSGLDYSGKLTGCDSMLRHQLDWINHIVSPPEDVNLRRAWRDGVVVAYGAKQLVHRP